MISGKSQGVVYCLKMNERDEMEASAEKEEQLKHTEEEVLLFLWLPSTQTYFITCNGPTLAYLLGTVKKLGIILANSTLVWGTFLFLFLFHFHFHFISSIFNF